MKTIESTKIKQNCSFFLWKQTDWYQSWFLNSLNCFSVVVILCTAVENTISSDEDGDVIGPTLPTAKVNLSNIKSMDSTKNNLSWF